MKGQRVPAYAWWLLPSTLMVVGGLVCALLLAPRLADRVTVPSGLSVVGPPPPAAYLSTVRRPPRAATPPARHAGPAKPAPPRAAAPSHEADLPATVVSPSRRLVGTASEQPTREPWHGQESESSSAPAASVVGTPQPTPSFTPEQHVESEAGQEESGR